MTRPRISYLWLLILAILLAVTAWYAGRTYELQQQVTKAKAQGPTLHLVPSVPAAQLPQASVAEKPKVEAAIQPKPAPKSRSCGQIMRVNPQSWCSDDSRDFRGQPLVRNWRFGKLQSSHRRAR